MQEDTQYRRDKNSVTKRSGTKTPYLGRLNRVRKLLATHNQEGLLVTGLPNVRYLSGFEGSNGVLLIVMDDAVLYTDGRYAIQAHQQACGVGVTVVNGRFLVGVVEDLKKRKIRNLAFEQNRLTFAEYQYFRQYFRRCRLKPLHQPVECQRVVKNPDEIHRIRQSVDLNSRVFDNVCQRAKPEWSELRMAAEIEYEMRFLGATGIAFDTIIASGIRSALPHATPGQGLLSRNSPIVVDQGAILDGYVSDMTRMVCFGDPGNRFRELHSAVGEAQMAAKDAVKAGVKASTVDKRARKVLAKFGLDKAFMHSTGHGVGLEIHEPPRLGAAEDTRLSSGMVITIEPGVYVDGIGGVRVEDVVVVTPTGCDVLTKTPREIRVL